MKKLFWDIRMKLCSSPAYNMTLLLKRYQYSHYCSGVFS